MKRLGIVGAFVAAAFLMAAFVMPNMLSAQAQESSAGAAWEITVAPYSSGNAERLAVVKHNTVTGQTLILTCDNRCSRNEEWYDYSVAE